MNLSSVKRYSRVGSIALVFLYQFSCRKGILCSRMNSSKSNSTKIASTSYVSTFLKNIQNFENRHSIGNFNFCGILIFNCYFRCSLLPVVGEDSSSTPTFSVSTVLICLSSPFICILVLSSCAHELRIVVKEAYCLNACWVPRLFSLLDIVSNVFDNSLQIVDSLVS